MASDSGADLRKAAGEGEHCVKPRRQGARLSKAPLAGTLCVFQHPREPGERELGWLAERQHWCLHRRQLGAGGVGRKGIAGRIARAQLHPLLSDVFLYGRREPTPLTLAMAVALHLRGDGVISGEYATWIWELTDLRPDQIIATLVGRSTSPIDGVALRRIKSIHPSDVRWRKGIPVTSPARSAIDFAGSGASVPRVESAFAMLRRGTPDRQIRATLERLPANHPGVPITRRLLELPPGSMALTKSIYERRLRALLKQAGLPAPISNHLVAGKERDLVWPEARLIVEFDSWEFHREKFLDDRARDAKAVAAGWRVIRLTADRVDHDALAVIAEIAAALAAAA